MGGLCPKCGGELDIGYGLAGGGVGPYVYCSRDECDFFEKFEEVEDVDDPDYPPLKKKDDP